jgi:hypothetical protein
MVRGGLGATNQAKRGMIRVPSDTKTGAGFLGAMPEMLACPPSSNITRSANATKPRFVPGF